MTFNVLAAAKVVCQHAPEGRLKRGSARAKKMPPDKQAAKHITGKTSYSLTC
ncbi:hypothetical protein HMPREF9123_0550 [Neisseria bacilliformis ATCC BAA-1200]|uniref:Uncharacterized protein n=1 Tax=Neisseria bacilliformis ATCC BAA-1200 TaxID=888742 RepID=F2BA23_9NEIS|nr:hypothetical protein HMPREF9123_0550 [Neisseria bacilliformis ATCC BAA-1200]